MSWQVDTAARTVWAEARGEPEDGQRACAHVIVNRMRDGRWGKTLAAVCLFPVQFSCWLGGDPNRKALAELSDEDPLLQKITAYVEAALNGEPDPTGGAMWYFATTMKDPPVWAKRLTFVKQIGRHKFFADAK